MITVLRVTHTFVHNWNEPYLSFLPSRRASPHFGWYSFPVPLRVGGWVGLGSLVKYRGGLFAEDVTRPSTNWARHRVTSLIRPTMLPLRHATTSDYTTNSGQRRMTSTTVRDEIGRLIVWNCDPNHVLTLEKNRDFDVDLKNHYSTALVKWSLLRSVDPRGLRKSCNCSNDCEFQSCTVVCGTALNLIQPDL